MRDEDLVMAIPRRELYKVSGFTRVIDYALLESIDQEHWFSAPSLLQGNPDAKEVRIGVVVTRMNAFHEQILITEEGVMLHAAAIPPELARFGVGLRALRELARAAANELLTESPFVIELNGYLNDETLSECRDIFILVYRVVVSSELPAPQGMTWVGVQRLNDIALDPVSALVVSLFAHRVSPG